jgi:hypothetical protein
LAFFFWNRIWLEIALFQPNFAFSRAIQPFLGFFNFFWKIQKNKNFDGVWLEFAKYSPFSVLPEDFDFNYF